MEASLQRLDLIPRPRPKSPEFKKGEITPVTDTPPKTNMSPENWWLEDVFPIEIVPFVGDMLVFPGCTHCFEAIYNYL